ncbi:MAG: rhomboid family intramembrane serine protease [Nanoarchaeota archaeon]|nr:rhomboid family intramembrane serine protease [Nanoarchaeota archaeon]
MDKNSIFFKKNYSYNNEKKIRGDFHLIVDLLKEFFLFLLNLPFNLFFLIYFLIVFNKEKVNFYFSKIFMAPFKFFSEISSWFFEAKYTAYLIISLFIIYFLQFLVFIPLGIMDSLLFAFINFFEGNYCSFLTSIFLHADLAHLLGNCLGILIFGRIVEKQFHSKVFWIFLISAVIANLISGYIYYLIGDNVPGLGASGGLAGLIMFAILLEPFVFTTIFILPLPIFLIGWFFMFWDYVGLNDGSNVNHLAHLSGYVAILILFFFIEFRNKKKLFRGFLINIFVLLLIFLISKYFYLGDLLSIFGF